MSGLKFTRRDPVCRFGLKGPGAADWLASRGFGVPAVPNTWAAFRHSGEDAVLVARLGTGEFFLEDCIGGTTLHGLAPRLEAHPPGVYPVPREDAAFLLSGPGAEEVLAEVCNVDFAALVLADQPVIMTSIIGVSMLVVPEAAGIFRRYRIWCDPTFEPYVGRSLSAVVNEYAKHGGGGAA